MTTLVQEVKKKKKGDVAAAGGSLRPRREKPTNAHESASSIREQTAGIKPRRRQKDRSDASRRENQTKVIKEVEDERERGRFVWLPEWSQPTQRHSDNMFWDEGGSAADLSITWTYRTRRAFASRLFSFITPALNSPRRLHSVPINKKERESLDLDKV